MPTKKKKTIERTQEHLSLRALVRQHAHKPGGMTLAEIHARIQGDPKYAGPDLLAAIELCLDELSFLKYVSRFGDYYIAWSYRRGPADTRCPRCSYQGAGNSLTTICPSCRRFSVE